MRIATLLAGAFVALCITGTSYASIGQATTAPSLGITMSAPAQVVSGPFTYTAVVTNSGGDASDVVLDDDLPFRTYSASASSTQGTCAVTQVPGIGGFTYHDHVHCDLGPLASGASATVLINDNDTAVGPVTNTASVSLGVAGSVPASASATIVFQPTDAAVSITPAASAYTGDNFSDSIVVTNNGPSSIVRTDLWLTLDGANYVSASGTGATCSFSSGQVYCYLDGMAAGESRTVTLTLVRATVGQAAVHARLDLQNAYDTVPANDTADAATSVALNPITPAADLALTFSGPSSLKNGGGFAYTATVTNTSLTTSAANVRVTIPVTGGLGLGGYTVPGGYCNLGGGATCFLGALGAGQSVTFSVWGSAYAEGTAKATATVVSDTVDPNPLNDSVTVTTQINPGPDLAISMTAPAQVQTAPFNYTITVKNVSTVNSAGAAIDDDLPFRTFFASATPSQGTCTITQQPGVGGFTYHDHVRCDLGPLAAGASATVTITEHDLGQGPVTNTATLSSTDGDTNAANNNASATTIFGLTDESVAISAPASADTDANFTDAITVTNAGPTTVSRTDLYLTPSVASYVSATGSGATCSNTGYGQVYCYLDGMTAGETRTVSLTLVSSAVGTASVGARISLQSGYETNTANNTASASTQVTRPGGSRADFALSATGPANATLHDQIRETVTLKNNGPDPSYVRITGALPSGLAFSAYGNSDCFTGTAGFECFASLASGASKTFTVYLTVTGGGSETVALSLYGAGLPDPDSSNNTASVTTDVPIPAPTIVCPAGAAVATDAGAATATIDPGTATAANGTAPVTVSGSRSDSAALSAPYPIGATTIVWTATDAAGLQATCSQIVTVSDDEAPVTSASVPAAHNGWYTGSVVVHLSAADNSGTVAAIHAGTGGPETSTAGDSADITVSAEGETTVSYYAVDLSGNAETPKTVVVKIDRTAPAFSCAAAGLAWNGDNVTRSCAATDNGGSGLDGPGTFTLATHVAQGTESDDAATDTQDVCDLAGNCVTAGPLLGNKVDLAAPRVACDAPDGAWHASNVSYTCTATDPNLSGASSFTLATSVPDGSETADASTGSQSVCDTFGHCATAGPIVGSKVDRKAPTLQLPAQVVVDASSPAGATVSYAASATDGGAIAHPVVSCTPASGSTFAAGTATVSCSATDAVGNVASESFSVTVKGASAELGDLTAKNDAYLVHAPSRTALDVHLQTALDAIGSKRPALACNALNAYIANLGTGSVARVLPAAQRDELVADARRIRAVLGCG